MRILELFVFIEENKRNRINRIILVDSIPALLFSSFGFSLYSLPSLTRSTYLFLFVLFAYLFVPLKK